MLSLHTYREKQHILVASYLSENHIDLFNSIDYDNDVEVNGLGVATIHTNNGKEIIETNIALECIDVVSLDKFNSTNETNIQADASFHDIDQELLRCSVEYGYVSMNLDDILEIVEVEDNIFENIVFIDVIGVYLLMLK